jgi:hypothetical protein
MLMKTRTPKLWILLPLLACTAVLSGCVSYYAVPAGKPKAQVVFDLATESTGATGRFYLISAFDDLASCKASPYGSSLARMVFTEAQELTAPIDVVAGEPLAFGVRYSQSIFGGNRDCSFVGTFTPEPSGLYVVSFRTLGEVSSCGMRVQQQAAAATHPIEIHAPERTCFGSVANKWNSPPLANGQAGAVNMNVNIVPPVK